jgi:hypothetical protein
MDKKNYLGYSPKSKNVEKLAKYIEKKKTETGQKSVTVFKTNPVLKNKRF